MLNGISRSIVAVATNTFAVNEPVVTAAPAVTAAGAPPATPTASAPVYPSAAVLVSQMPNAPVTTSPTTTPSGPSGSTGPTAAPPISTPSGPSGSNGPTAAPPTSTPSGPSGPSGAPGPTTKPTFYHQGPRDVIDKLMDNFNDGKAFTKAEKALIEKHISEKGIKLDTIKKIAALKPGDPKALLILNADPYFKTLGFLEKLKLGNVLNKITTETNNAMKKVSAALKKDGFSDADITKIKKATIDYMIKFGLGTMEGLEHTDETVSTGIIHFTPLNAALLQLGYALRDNKNTADILKDLK